jgi:uncharacterized membrane protein YfcA
MMIFAHTVAAETLAVGVMFAAACRMVPLHVSTHKRSWIAAYFAMFCGAVVALWGDIPTHGPQWSTTLLLAACAAYLWLSRHTWRNGAPEFMRR